MSKIHEALKRAEEERSLGDAGTRVVESLPVNSWLPEINVIGAEAVQRALSEAPKSPPLSWESICARCHQVQWRPTKQMLFLNDNSPQDIGIEEFRTLRSRLNQLRAKHSLKIILVASPLPAEGKTFLAANLAQVLAQEQKSRVLLMDGDLRRSRLHEALGASGEPGISDYLTRQADEMSIMQRGPLENLVFVPGGRAASNPAELIADGRLKALLKRLAEVFEWIVLDSPPVVPVSDASVIARACDGVLMVVRAAKTPFELAQRARREFRDIPVLGVVLNRVQDESIYYFKSYAAAGAKS